MCENRGGAIAISGYLYQILSATRKQVSAESEEGVKPRTDALVYVHEAHGQDAGVVDPKTGLIKLVQIKYSEQGTAKKIPPKELKEIVRRLFDAEESAKNAGKTIVGYGLTSNRGLSDKAEIIRKSPDKGDPDPVKLAAKIEARAAKKAAKAEPAKAGASSAKPAEDDDGDELPWTAEHKRILAALEVETVEEATVNADLCKFGALYGVLVHEVGDKIDTLIGKIFKGVAALNGARIDLDDLVEVFTGYRKTVSLVRAGQMANQERELARVTPLPGPFPEQHKSREAVEGLLTKYGDRSIIVFCGKGGTGKTASLRQLACEQIGAPDGPFLRARPAKDMPRHWAPSCADEWRDIGRLDEAHLSTALQRLRGANSEKVAPILMIALDGIDDDLDLDRRGDISRLVEKASDADPTMNDFRLVVTCREAREFEGFLPMSVDGFDRDRSGMYQLVEFDKFTKTEFIALVAMELKDYLPILLEDDFGTPSLSAGEASSTGRIQTKTLASKYDYLRDPVIWRAFTELGTDYQKKVLAGDVAGQKALGLIVVARFCRKAHRRLNFVEEDLYTTLQAIARAVDAVQGAWTKKLWMEKGDDEGLVLTKPQCGKLFEEALSGGLIEKPKDAWTWRHESIFLSLKA